MNQLLWVLNGIGLAFVAGFLLGIKAERWLEDDKVGEDENAAPQTEEDIRHIAKDGFGVFLDALKDGKLIADKAGRKYDWADFTKAQDLVRKMSK